MSIVLYTVPISPLPRPSWGHSSLSHCRRGRPSYQACPSGTQSYFETQRQFQVLCIKISSLGNVTKLFCSFLKDVWNQSNLHRSFSAHVWTYYPYMFVVMCSTEHAQAVPGEGLQQDPEFGQTHSRQSKLAHHAKLHHDKTCTNDKNG